MLLLDGHKFHLVLFKDMSSNSGRDHFIIHGFSVLPIVVEYNAACIGEKYQEIARAMGAKG